MSLIIDGYNLLHVTGIVGQAGSGLRGSREALLRFLASAIDAKELPLTTVVFDAAEAPPGLPRTVTHEGMTVRYASDYENADALIEELIVADNVPRSLTVVSSDHRLQRAARRRRAAFVDSDIWFSDALRRRSRLSAPESRKNPRPASLTPDEINYWIAEFAEAPVDDRLVRARRRAAEPPPDNPFPPGYADDLLGD